MIGTVYQYDQYDLFKAVHYETNNALYTLPNMATVYLYIGASY